MKLINDALFDDLFQKAAASPRQRANRNFHSAYGDSVQRFCNALQPGSYVRPHRHSGDERWEFTLALAGSAVVLFFDDASIVTERIVLSVAGPTYGVEIPAGQWHTLAALAPRTVLLELKRGPYVPMSDKDFASWAPPEHHPAAMVFSTWYVQAKPGAAGPVW